MELSRATVAKVMKVLYAAVALTVILALLLPLAAPTVAAMATLISLTHCHVIPQRVCVWHALTMPQDRNVTFVPMVSMAMLPDNLVNHASVMWMEPRVSHVIKHLESVTV